jgi:DNA-directed RNA polymerase II subunit RPB1
MAVDRHGINRVESGPLLRCSFEETVDMLNDAACFAEEEVLRGVTENIMMGQLARVGTGDMDLLLDEQKVVRDAVEVVVDGFEGDKDLGLAGGIGMPTPYASTPFASSPSMNGSVEMSPFHETGGFSPAVGGFSPSYSPASGSYTSGSYGNSDDFGSASPVSGCCYDIILHFNGILLILIILLGILAHKSCIFAHQPGKFISIALKKLWFINDD